MCAVCFDETPKLKLDISVAIIVITGGRYIGVMGLLPDT